MSDPQAEVPPQGEPDPAPDAMSAPGAEAASEAERQPSMLVKQLLELGPLLVFVAVYLWLRDQSVSVFGREYAGFVVAVVAFVPLQIASTVAMRLITGRLSRMQIATLILVVILGLGTVLFNDERLFKMKSTFIFGFFGILLFIGLARGQSWLAYVLDQALPLSRQGWMLLTKRMAWFFLAFAAMNEVVWRNFSTDIYVFWDTFGQMGVMLAFFAANYKLIDTHWVGPR